MKIPDDGGTGLGILLCALLAGVLFWAYMSLESKQPYDPPRQHGSQSR